MAVTAEKGDEVIMRNVHKGIHTLRPEQNGRHGFKCIFMNENV